MMCYQFLNGGMEMHKKFMTKLTHLGEKVPAGVVPPKVPPIYLSSVFTFDDVETLDKIYEKEETGYVYSRLSNPSHEVLKEIMTNIDEGDGAQVYSSGMAAITMSILANVKAGDHIIADNVLYGGTYQFFKEQLTRFNIGVSFVDLKRDNIENYFRPNTKLIYMETITNPLMEVVDIKKIADTAHEHGAKLIVDNTFASPIICQPLKHGADVVVYSATKYLCGHSDIIGGVVVSDKATIEEIGKVGSIYGPTMSPFDAWLLTRSLRTLEMRVVQHSNNAQKLAQFFDSHPKIKQVYYPGLKTSQYNDVARKIFNNNLFGGMMSIDLGEGEAGAEKFIKSLNNIKFVPSLACYTTSISYPAKTSHRGMTEEEMKKSGITKGLIRISAGLENIDDLLDEFNKALNQI